tara:strand:- start:994 stop:1470 length:477 start_codon:yes stop_codon:yes gene_type:complete
MTDSQRDKGRMITLSILICIVLLAMCSGCSQLLYKTDSIYVTHVLALTNRGDTVKIKLNQIQPQKMYHVVGYDFVRYIDNRFYIPNNDRLYDMRYSNRYSYYGDPYGSYGKVYKNKKEISTVNSYSRGGYTGKTRGGGNNPVASNPVTSGRGLRGKNN